MLGDVWFVEHCAAVAFTMLALRELAGKKPLARRFRPGNVTTGPERAHARMRNFALMLVPFVAAWAWYTFARWGVWYDIGYTEFFHHDGWGQTTGSPFRYYLNGWYQYGMRHALDFEPFLLILMALAARTGIPRWTKGLICWSAAMSVWGVWYWDAYYRTGN